MLTNFKKFLREILIEMEIIKISKEEKIIRINKKYKNDSNGRYVRIMALYEKELNELWQKNPEEWYYKFVDICAEHELDFTIPCSGPT